MSVKLNLGCGWKRLEGYINVDNSMLFAPDEVVDLNHIWPWPSNSIDEIVASHVIEHLRLSPVDVMQNLYRVLRPGGKAIITVPHPRSDDFLNDPTHRQAYMPATFEFFSKKINQFWQDNGWSNTPLALMHDIDFLLEHTNVVVKPAWQMRVGLEAEKIVEAAQMFNNVISEFTVTLVKQPVSDKVKTA